MVAHNHESYLMAPFYLLLGINDRVYIVDIMEATFPPCWYDSTGPGLFKTLEISIQHLYLLF